MKTLRFNNYNINYLNLTTHNCQQKNFSIEYKITKKIEKVEEKIYNTALIFSAKPKEEGSSPISISMQITGQFIIEDEKDLKEISNTMVSILFPILNSILATVTSIANIPPLKLNNIDLVSMFEKAEQENIDKENNINQ